MHFLCPFIQRVASPNYLLYLGEWESHFPSVLCPQTFLHCLQHQNCIKDELEVLKQMSVKLKVFHWLQEHLSEHKRF